MIFDHVDLRVTDVGLVRPFYDAFLRGLGFRGRPQNDGTMLYFRLENRTVREAIAVIPDTAHRPNKTRLAFSAASREEVDRLAAIAERAGARAFEPPELCDDIAPNYYAAFFEDPDGNRLEVVCR